MRVRLDAEAELRRHRADQAEPRQAPQGESQGHRGSAEEAGRGGDPKVKDGAQLALQLLPHAGRARPVPAAARLRQALRRLPSARLRRPLPRQRGAARQARDRARVPARHAERGLRSVPGHPGRRGRQARSRRAASSWSWPRRRRRPPPRATAARRGDAAAAPRPRSRRPADEPRGGRLRGAPPRSPSRGGARAPRRPRTPRAAGACAGGSRRGRGRRRRDAPRGRRGRGAAAAAGPGRAADGLGRDAVSSAIEPGLFKQRCEYCHTVKRDGRVAPRSCRRPSPRAGCPTRASTTGRTGRWRAPSVTRPATSTETKDVLMPNDRDLPRVPSAEGRRPQRLRGVPPLSRQVPGARPERALQGPASCATERWVPRARIE